MNLEASLAIYLILWWVVLFTILPRGIVSHHEAGIKAPGGGDPASPVDPKLKQKFITTTWVSALVFAPFWVAVQMHWLTISMFRGLP